jgi:Astacin (Peptidase family M12A)
LNLSRENGCINFAIIIHEFLHAVGIHHMFCAPDRDNYVRINMDNVEEGMEHNFVKLPESEFSQFGVPYDFTSVMHYSEYLFARDPSIPTIVALRGEAIRPTEDTWSWYDIERINRAFCGKPW